MYNANLKQDFIKQQNIGETATKRYYFLFDKTEVFESAMEKDIAEMSSGEFQYVFSNIDIKGSYSYTYGNISLLKQYIYWCKTNTDFNIINEVNNIEDQGYNAVLFTFIDKMVSSPQDLIDKCDILLPDVKDLRIDNFLRAYLYLLFCGFTENEIVEIKVKDLDTLFNNLIYSEFIPHLNIISDMEYYNKGKQKINLKNSSSFDLLIKNCSESSKTKESMKSRLSKASRIYKKNNNKKLNLSCNNVYKSGYYYKAYLQEKNNNLNLTKLSNQSGISISIFKREFKLYKQAFRY